MSRQSAWGTWVRLMYCVEDVDAVSGSQTATRREEEHGSEKGAGEARLHSPLGGRRRGAEAEGGA